MFNLLLSVVVFFLFGGRELLNRRVEVPASAAAATERFERGAGARPAAPGPRRRWPARGRTTDERGARRSTATRSSR